MMRCFQTKRFRVVAIAAACAMVLQAGVLAYYAKYSPGPWTTYDSQDTAFNTQHNINYDWYGSGGLYTRSTKLYVDVLNSGDSVDCGYGYAEKEPWTDETFMTTIWGPFPLTYYNTPYWWTVAWEADHEWIGSGDNRYITYRQKTGNVGGSSNCYFDYIMDMGGWQSSVNIFHQWNHIHINGWP